MRSINSNSQLDQIEQGLLEGINATGLGPMGLGGYTTVLPVHIESDQTYITPNMVAVVAECWIAIRK